MNKTDKQVDGYRLQRVVLEGMFWFCFALLGVALISIFLVGVEW
jgi:hypothetical protein